jgi:uncharacterized membrane protein YadS
MYILSAMSWLRSGKFIHKSILIIVIIGLLFGFLYTTLYKIVYLKYAIKKNIGILHGGKTAILIECQKHFMYTL